MRYWSRKDIPYTVIIWGMIFLSVYHLSDAIRQSDYSFWSLAFPLIFGGSFVWIWFGTYYVITDDILHIRSGPLRWKFPIQAIKEVRKAKNIWASPVLSLDRLEIIHSESMIYVSPKDEKSFLDELARKNPNIHIVEEDGEGL